LQTRSQSYRYLGVIALCSLELALLTALILVTRCANYKDVLFAGDVYFTDADCYARMTRVRMCAEHPGLIVRHHDFENYPQGTTPHTTAPLDYLILLLAVSLRPFTSHALDLGGALISPLFALLGGWFLYWWSRRMKLSYRWALLILYAISPILVHGTELGRPDHQSLLILLVTIAICAEWSLQIAPSQLWSVMSGVAWALAIWVSAYEPLALLVIVLLLLFGWRMGREQIFSEQRRAGWICFAGVLGIALLIERRIPAFPVFHVDAILQNWSRTIGELRPVPPFSPVWLRWTGWSLGAAPFLVWWNYRSGKSAEAEETGKCVALMTGLVVATYLLTLWQARWAYFFVLIFAIALPVWLERIKFRRAVWIVFFLSLLPVLRDWDEKLWPNESELARRFEQQKEAIDLRELALTMKSGEVRSFLAVWWLSPAVAYWSGQPGVAGSSHEGIDGIARSARFFATEDWQKARGILENQHIEWVLAYDADRTGESCAAILGEPVAKHALCYVLDRAPAQTSRFLALAAQNPSGKLLRVVNNR
jgi:hypothetical protein